MLRILHLTDFHLNQRTLKDWNNYIREALLSKVDSINEEEKINFIAFTGDMIDQGGQDFESPEIAFETFKENVIDPLLQNLGLPKDNFLIVPGNHDVVRNLDSDREEIGNKIYFEKLENISSYIQNAEKNKDFSGMKRMIPYKAFERKLYEEANVPSKFSLFSSSFILENEGIKVGVSCLNSAWRSFDKNDRGHLLIGEDQLLETTKFIEKTDFKIALMHHPLDAISNVENKVISNQIYDYYDLLLVGDYHESTTSMVTGITGSVFVNLAPSCLSDIRTDSKRYSNGFTVVDVNFGSREACISYYRYNHTNRKFFIDPESSGSDDGKYCQPLPTKERKKDTSVINSILENIIENHYPEMDKHMIGIRAEINISSLKEAFIMPPVTSGKSLPDDDDEENYNITQIVKLNNSLIFFGSKESGKTVLLYRLVQEYVDQFQHTRKIPVYINFDEIGNKSFLTIIREYLSCKIAEVKSYLESNKIVLLVDNLDYKEIEKNQHKLKQFHRFVEENSGIQVIATAEGDILGAVPPMEYIQYCKIPFQKFYIQNLSVKEIKSLMKMWSPNDDSLRLDTRLDKMVTDFHSYALPSTAMSVSLFLWSTENSDRKPVNNAVLLEIYIEIILEKLTQENIYRSSFDFKNKLQLLSRIAEVMLDEDEENYSLSYSEFLKSIEIYLSELVGFDFDSKVIAEYFIERKIFTRFSGNRIKFTYSCFFHFFLAKRMEFNIEFREYVLGEDVYYNYVEEIDYYTGLTRSDKNLLETIYTRFTKEFQHTDFIFNELEGKWDKFFIIKSKSDVEKNEAQFESVAKRTEISQIKDNRPSDELIEEFQNKRLANIREPGKIIKKEGEVSLEKLLVVMSNVLRNSEGVEDFALKKEIYNTLIKYVMNWMVLYREYLIDYILKNEKLPPSFPNNLNIQQVLMNIPFHVQVGMNKHLGTAKLAPVILSKINMDLKGNTFTKSDLEGFLSVALYADVQGNDFPVYFKKFIKTLKNTPVRDFSYYKLITYYYRRTKEGSPNEELYLDMLMELRTKSQNLPNQVKEKIRKAYIKSKKNLLGDGQ